MNPPFFMRYQVTERLGDLPEAAVKEQDMEDTSSKFRATALTLQLPSSSLLPTENTKPAIILQDKKEERKSSSNSRALV